MGSYKEGVSYLIDVDEYLKKVHERVGKLEENSREANFEGLVRIIINQQLSGKVSTAIFTRLSESVNNKFCPQTVFNTDRNIFYTAGISQAKTRFIKNVCSTFIETPNFIESLQNMTDEEAQNKLTQINGIGEWSARIFLMFYLQRMNVFATGDSSINRAIREIYGNDEVETVQKLTSIWSPFNTVACLLLWKWIDTGAPSITTVLEN